MAVQRLIILLLAMLLVPILPAQVQDFSADVVPSKETVELSGSLLVSTSFLSAKTESLFYKLLFQGQPLQDYLFDFNTGLYLNGDYQTSKMGVHLHSYSSYSEPIGFTSQIFELFGTLNISDYLFLSTGKITHNWGKGYAFNPAGFANSKKNPEDPELPLDGRLNLNMELQYSFQNPSLQNMAFQMILFPPPQSINSKFSDIRNTDCALKSYFLVFDSDIDLLAYLSRTNQIKYGIDFSRNIVTSLEIHGEYAYIIEDSDSAQSSYLLGLRWLNRLNVTTIFEFYHQDDGWESEEFVSYLSSIGQKIESGNLNADMNLYSASKDKAVLMKDYLYLKLSWPEPFNLLYFTPASYVLYNLEDQSALVALNLSWKPVSNLEILLTPSFSTGHIHSEFGSKFYSTKTDLKLTYSF